MGYGGLITLLCLQNLPDDINSGEMKLYIEAHANASISSTVYGLEPGSVLIEFHDDPGIHIYSNICGLTINKYLLEYA